ncbi:hypothetical protein K8352_09450 [Flavobacteriaceae bacterium F89]|uniref:Adhesin domain-containing protein n=1 Tax=Cerina litoralis TaxID=2874477 RepID=A0AAE3EWJ5_9FLAO|nr:hypothetical protein [Cerina litoralis]MCG2460971.1 hypothetical protein [Cerina litoralis]
MKQSLKTIRAITIAILGLTMVQAFGQKQTKTYKENFNVNKDAILELNTSNADIEFDTWNKDQVSVVAVVEIEGLTPEEASGYFDDHEVRIIGNSNKVEVSTGGGYGWVFNPEINLEGLNIAIPDIPEMEPLLLNIPDIPDIPEIDAMPPVPMAPVPPFDYEAYKKDGEKYLKQWQKDFQKNYGEEYQKKMEAWAEKMKAKREVMEEKRREMTEAREKAREQMNEAREQQREIQQEAREKQREAMEERRVIMAQQRGQSRIILRDSDRGDNIYYRSSHGKNENIKIRKTIKIKMPKSVRLKMNVRHGEVKLTGDTKNMSANLSYATLLATTIDGIKTNIMASYTPVRVQNWNEGQLRADYSENIDLKEVGVLTLNSISSNVTIDQMLNSALIKNSFGVLTINSVAPNFTKLDIFVENSELDFSLPQSAFDIQINSTASNVKPPAKLTLKKTGDDKKSAYYKGYHLEGNTERDIILNSKYSDIVLK